MRTIILLLAWLSLSASALSQNLVAYYPFNGNNNDESGNSINPTYTGAGVILTTDRFGNANKAYNFDGATNSYMRMPSDLLPTTNRTVSFWFNAATVSIRPFMLTYGGNSGPPGTSFLMGLNASGCGCYHTQAHYNTNAVSYTYGADPVNQWIHWVVTVNGSTTKMYVNGTLVANVPGSFTSNTYVSGRDLAIGVMVNSVGIAPYTDVNGSYFQGKLDDIRIYDNAMTDAQVQNLYNNESTGLVAYYPFNGNANDESGNGYNGTVSGATLTTDRFNQSDKAYNFFWNGFSSDKIQVPGTSGLNFSTGGFSLSAWVKFSGAASGGYNYPIVSKHNCSEQSGYILMLYNDKITFWLAGAGGYSYISTPDNYTDGNWHHVAAVYNGTNRFIYVDGVLKTSDAFAYTTPNNANIALGGYNGCNGGFNGKVDDIRIYDAAMTDAQVQAIYISELNGWPLPVTLLNLQVRKTNTTTAQLTWQTATEINNKGFEVQRSIDGNYFSDVRFINGAGNANDIREYSITDVPGRTGRVYYRLKQIDFDGNSKLSNIVSVLFDKLGIIKVYPNPAQRQVTVEGIENFSKLQILDATGKLLKEQNINKQYQVSINLNELTSGLYLLRLVNEKEIQIIKLVIKN